MASLYSHVRLGFSVAGLADEQLRSLLLGEILWNISQIETEMSLVIGHALGMHPSDAVSSIRDLNFDSKIRILESNASRISIEFESKAVREAFLGNLRKLKDVRNVIAHGVIFSDEKGLYLNIPSRSSQRKNCLSLDRADLEKIVVLTTSVATGLMLARNGGRVKMGKER